MTNVKWLVVISLENMAKLRSNENMRITDTKSFIEKANEIYHDKFDYLLTEYVKSSERVKIICPVHGIFEQTPNKHLKGDGCVLCKKAERLEEKRIKFIEAARLVHGDNYDYSKVNFELSPDGKKVCIICPDHGEFYQTYSAHVSAKQNCPKCSAHIAGMKRSGSNNVAHRQDVQEKKRKTCRKRYGTNTWAESMEGRQKLHDIVTSIEVATKMKNTCQERYGADIWSQSDEGKAKLHEIMSSDEMREKVVSGYIRSYDVEHYMKTEEGREKARNHINSEERQQKIHESMYEKYGVYSFLESDEFKIHAKTYREKAWKTKRKHGTFNTSKPEQTMLLLLQDIFGEDDVVSQYKCDRYPFACDFYVKSLDLFIELNVTWTHGGHFFDENNLEDVNKLDEWKKKAKTKGSRYYHCAIETWTKRDVLKLHMAIDNNLNYLVFWNNDLTDFRSWLESQLLL